MRRITASCLLAAVCTMTPFRNQQRSSYALAHAASNLYPKDRIPLPQSYVNASTAVAIDVTLMRTPGFTIEQLMELAGLSVAEAVNDYYMTISRASVSESDLDFKKMKQSVLIIAGPGNNGGDGLVAARHLSHLGFKCTVVYPKQGKGLLFENLVQQCRDVGVVFITDPVEMAELSARGLRSAGESFDLVIDAIFGFSFTGYSREPFASLITAMRDSGIPTVSVDVPSGWHVDKGDVNHTGFYPDALVSLTVPKLCAKAYRGEHYVGGRFITPELASTYSLDVPQYKGTSQIAKYVPFGSGSNVSNPKESDISVVYVTASNEAEGKHIAKGLLAQKLAACVNLSPVVSMYEWNGKLEESAEVLLMIKTQTQLVPELTAAVKALHSYEVPEVISVPVGQGSEAYFSWVRTSTREVPEQGKSPSS